MRDYEKYERLVLAFEVSLLLMVGQNAVIQRWRLGNNATRWASYFDFEIWLLTLARNEPTGGTSGIW
jgi:hypothetical protein